MRRYALDARTATPHFPGIGRYVTNLAQALPPLLAEDEQLLTIAASGAPSPFGLRQQVVLPRWLRRQQAAVYHSPYYLMPYRPRVPTVVTIYDLIPLLLPHTVSARARLLFRLTTRLALAAAEAVIAISHATRRDLLAAFALDPQRVHVIPLAADPMFHPATADAIAAVRARYALPERFLLYLGINKPHKGLPELIDAYTKIGADWQLVIAGAWDERYPAVRKLIATRGLAQRVRLLGRVPAADLPALYSAATLFVFPSHYEGFGLPPLEALACGTPVACADNSSLPEVVGDAAALFASGSADTIAATLQALIDDPAALAALAARAVPQAARFSWTATAARTLDLYRTLAAGP